MCDCRLSDSRTWRHARLLGVGSKSVQAGRRKRTLVLAPSLRDRWSCAGSHAITRSAASKQQRLSTRNFQRKTAKETTLYFAKPANMLRREVARFGRVWGASRGKARLRVVGRNRANGPRGRPTCRPKPALQGSDLRTISAAAGLAGLGFGQTSVPPVSFDTEIRLRGIKGMPVAPIWFQIRARGGTIPAKFRRSHVAQALSAQALEISTALTLGGTCGATYTKVRRGHCAGPGQPISSDARTAASGASQLRRFMRP